MKTMPASEGAKERSSFAESKRGSGYVVVYDGDCKVCGRIVEVLKKWDRDRALEIIPSQDPSVRTRFPGIPPHAYVESMQVVRTSDGKTWQGGAALEQLLKVLPKGWLASWLFTIPFARPLAEKFYRWFARNRFRMGCSDHCAVGPPDPNYRDGDRGKQ
jgi:predicted DCC family thiol-disulfide oxidoreductase YuxK